MKKKDIKELQQKTKAELAHVLQEKTIEFKRVLMDIATAKIKNTALLRTIKTDIARVKSIMHMKVEGK